MAKNRVRDFRFGLSCGITIHTPWSNLHRHDEVEITFFRTEKPVIFRISDKLLAVRSSDTLMFWGSLPHQIVEIEKEVEQYWFTVPLDIFLRWNLPKPLMRKILNGEVFLEIDEELRRMDLAAFPVWQKESEDRNQKTSTPLRLSMEARIRRFGAPSPMNSKGEQDWGLPADRIIRESTSLRCMSDYITENFRSEVRIDQVAEAAGLHPNYASCLFRQQSGTNIGDFLAMLRVYEAQRLLLTTDLKIIDIAMEAGFASMSNFYKTFKKICHKTPSSYRTGIRSS